MCSKSAHAESYLLLALVNFVQVSRKLTPKLGLAFVLASLPNVGYAENRPLEPIENPGECPIDAPLRVANVDTLRQYEGLLGHCEATAIIQSPAYRANRPSTPIPVRVPQSVPEWDDPSRQPNAGALVANRTDADKRVTENSPAPVLDAADDGTKVGDVRTIVAPDRSNVAIVPPPSRLVPRRSTEYRAGMASDEVEAILALRPQSYTTVFDEQIAQAARSHGVDPLLLHAVIRQESNYRDRAVSRAGARGLMQVMPGTGRMLGVISADDLFDSRINIDAGARLLSRLWRVYDGNIDLVLAAYNAGEGAVRRYRMQVPPFRETREYVAKVKANYALLAKESGLAVHF